MQKILPLCHILFLCAGICFLSVALPGPAAGEEKGWEYINTYEGVALYRSVNEIEGALPFKATAELEAPYQKIVMALVDAERKNEWAP